MNNKKFKKLCLGQSKVVNTTKSLSEENELLLTSKSNYLSTVNNLIHAFDILKLITTPVHHLSTQSVKQGVLTHDHLFMLTCIAYKILAFSLIPTWNHAKLAILKN